MNLQSFYDLLRWGADIFSSPPPPFLSGMVCGILLGMLLASVVPGLRTVIAWLRQSLLHSLAVVPPVVACLLWGAWFGMMAAKELAH